MESIKQLQEQISKLEELKSEARRNLCDYDVYTNPGMKSLAEWKLKNIKEKLSELYVKIAPLNDKMLQEYRESTTHKLLMASKGLSGFQILSHSVNNR